jgi:hypothetical protein
VQAESSTEPPQTDKNTPPRSSTESREALPLNALPPASPVSDADPATVPAAESTVVLTVRTPRRTLFAVTLQLSRCLSALCALVRAGFDHARKTVIDSALMIADGILFGARDRSRDKVLRPLYDQQRRSAALHQPRPARPRALGRAKPETSRKGKAA